VLGRLAGVEVDEREKPIAKVRLRGSADVLVPFELLQHDADGGYRLPGRWTDFKIFSDDGVSIPVIEESAKVDVRPAPERMLRVRRRVVTTEQVVETPVWHERIQVDRVPINQYVDSVPAPRQDGDVLIIPCIEEVVVVEKRLRVSEELRVRVVREQRTHRETVQLRRHELEIESAEQPLPLNQRKLRGD
jgi:stress response protein YsnF